MKAEGRIADISLLRAPFGRNRRIGWLKIRKYLIFGMLEGNIKFEKVEICWQKMNFLQTWPSPHLLIHKTTPVLHFNQLIKPPSSQKEI